MITSSHIKRKLLLSITLALLTITPINAMDSESPAQAAKKPSFNISKPYLALMAIGPALMITRHLIDALRPIQRVGVVTIDGAMKESGTAVQELQFFFKNSSIKAIVLKINSGGGATGTAQAIYHVIRELKAQYKKPIIAWVENIAASGAYYVASATDAIIATPSALVGSVGVIGQIWQLNEALKHFNVRHEIITSGEYKAFSNPLNDMTPQQKEMFQAVCDRTYQQFINDVQLSRPALAKLPIEEWANGKIFDAEYASRLGMIDQLGSQITIEQTIHTLTNNTQPIVFIYPMPTPFYAKYLDKQKLAVSAMVDQLWERFEQRVEQSGTMRIHMIG